MLQPLLDWYQQQTIRDQKVLKIGVAVVFFGLFYFILIKPLQHQRSQMAQRIIKAESDLNWMKNKSSLFSGTNSQSPQSSKIAANIIVTRAAKKYSLKLTRIQPKNNQQYGLWLEQVSFDNLLLWIQDIQMQGVQVTSMDINKTDSIGYVKATLTVSGSR